MAAVDEEEEEEEALHHKPLGESPDTSTVNPGALAVLALHRRGYLVPYCRDDVATRRK